jgi:hypothetical protein
MLRSSRPVAASRRSTGMPVPDHILIFDHEQGP